MKVATVWRKVEAAGHTVRAYRGPVPNGYRPYWARSFYPVEIDGVLRAYAGYNAGNYRHNRSHGFYGFSLMPSNFRQHGSSMGDCQRDVVAFAFRTPEDVLTVLAEKLDSLPTVDQVAPLLADADREIAEAKARRAAEDAQRKEEAATRQAEDQREQADMLEGLQLIRARADLTNFETAALERAIRRLAR